MEPIPEAPKVLYLIVGAGVGRFGEVRIVMWSEEEAREFVTDAREPLEIWKTERVL